MSKQFIAILVIIIGGLFGVLYFSSNKDDQSSTTTNQAITSPHIYGKADSEVKLVEYGDFQCPACKLYFPIVSQIKEEYKDKIAFEFRNFPLTSIHPNAFIGARGSEAAGLQGKFWEMHDLLYERQEAWSNDGNPTDILVAYAGELGLDTEKFRTDMNSTAVSDSISAQRSAGTNDNISATPSFVINGEKLDPTPRTVEEFKSAIDEKLGQNSTNP